MWHTYLDPPFVLPPKHAAVFRIAAGMLSDFIGWESWEDDWPGMGISAFDTLSQFQKQAAILAVAKALLDPKTDPPTVTAALAGTVHGIYVHLESSIEMEMGHETEVRQLILESLDECDYWNDVNSGLEPGEKPVKRPLAACRDMAEWGEFVEALRTIILEDYDFSMEKEFMDMPPDKAAALKRQLNIDPDYFVAVVEDPTPERVAEIRRELHSLLY
jgi:hypothetical protein